MKKPGVFISFSSEDKDWGHAFAHALRDKGLKVWLEDDAGSDGDRWIESMEKGFRASECFLFPMTPENVRRPNFMFELGAAVSAGKYVVPIVPKGTRLPPDDVIELSGLPVRFRARKAIHRGSPKKTAENLVELLSRLSINGGATNGKR